VEWCTFTTISGASSSSSLMAAAGGAGAARARERVSQTILIGDGGGDARQRKLMRQIGRDVGGIR